MASAISTPELKRYDSQPSDIKSRLATSYNAIAPQYNTFTATHDTLRLTYTQKLLSHLPQPTQDPSSQLQPKALELGCGACGSGTRLLLSHNFHVTGNDISSAQLELARANNEDFKDSLELKEGDMMSLTFPDASLDAVVAFYSIIHLPRAEQVVLISRIAGWLKPGGLFLANFSEAEAEGSVNEKWLGEKGWMFWSSWGGEQSVEMVEDAGLELLLREVSRDVADADFVWVLGRKK
ncbi:methyltransferase [Lophiotrema nucula]|uniref:Methyltransferase n=1 Tax=Lophiotrema nucula TaxID=690887 RepID=A0A6A5ZBX2_9PLEO|nr:methyltransferase [Lophiotrema nucula]